MSEHTFGDLEEEKLRPDFEEAEIAPEDYEGVLKYLEVVGQQLSFGEMANV